MDIRQQAYKELVTGDFKGPAAKREILDKIFAMLDQANEDLDKVRIEYKLYRRNINAKG